MTNALTIIPARGGSKRLPNKNILPFAGKPLIHWTIQAARQAGIPDPLISTDSQLVEHACQSEGVTVMMRPPELAQDDTPTIKVLQHILGLTDSKGFHADWVLLLQPTSPLRSPDDIQNALGSVCHACGGSKCQGSIISVTATEPLGGVGGATFRTNGAIYLIHRDSLLRGSLYGDDPTLLYMPPERSIDIDTIEDFKRAEELWNSGRGKIWDRVAGHT